MFDVNVRYPPIIVIKIEENNWLRQAFWFKANWAFLTWSFWLETDWLTYKKRQLKMFKTFCVALNKHQGRVEHEKAARFQVYSYSQLTEAHSHTPAIIAPLMVCSVWVSLVSTWGHTALIPIKLCNQAESPSVSSRLTRSVHRSYPPKVNRLQNPSVKEWQQASTDTERRKRPLRSRTWNHALTQVLCSPGWETA